MNCSDPQSGIKEGVTKTDQSFLTALSADDNRRHGSGSRDDAQPGG
jgi:hypothetical protein